MTPAPLRVLMVDDHPIVLAGLKALVEADPNFEVVGKAGDGLALCVWRSSCCRISSS